MYELSRLRLYSIGPAGARYADTVLDLRGVGEPVPQPAPAQGDFFTDEPTGPPRRPAPAGVLFLENGGGKSVLLKLIFSVMLPGHRNTLGGASSGVLRKFLLAEDCGHVALEWQHTLTGELVVVGKVSEWRGRQVSSDPRKFAEAWYSFRPGPGLGLDSLPVAEATAVRPPVEGTSGARGRRRTMKGFRDALTEAGKAYPHLEVVWEEIHDRWNEHLGDLGLDPELFRYQREMNADEGEAAGLFAVKKDSDFTDLLLRAVTDTRDTDGLADLVHGFAGKLGRRAELTAERDFTAGSLDLLDRIVGAAAVRDQARGVHAQSERRTRVLTRRLAARARQERGRAAELAQDMADAAHAVTDTEQARAGSARIAAELAYRHASLALAGAEKGAAALRRELTDARTLHAAWQTAETVLRHRAAGDRLARVTEAIRAAERDAAPALAARTQAAAELVRALQGAAVRAERQADDEEERSAGLQTLAEGAHRDATAAATEAQRARSESGHLGQRLAEVEQETAEAVRAGWLDDTAPDADPARAALAAADAERTAETLALAAAGTATAATARAREAAAGEARAELAAARATDALTAAATAHRAALDATAALTTDPRALALLGLGERGAAGAFAGPASPSPSSPASLSSSSSAASSGTGPAADPAGGGAGPAPAGADAGEGPGARQGEGPLSAQELDRFAEPLRELVEDAVATAERQMFELRTAAADDARILGALGDGGLLPPGPDVLATVEFLAEHGVPALPGWRYLAQAVAPADHAAVMAARPELVDGVVVTDPDSYARAREALAQAALLPRSTVAVGTAAALLAPPPGGTDSDVFLVPPNPAMHDEMAADGERRELRGRAAAREEEIRALAARLAHDRTLSARLASWRASCPPGRLAELAAEVAAAQDTAEEARADLAAAREERAEADAAAAEAGADHDARRAAAEQARRRADKLAGLAHRLRERANWQRRARELTADAAEAEARAETCLDRARAADEDRRAAQRASDDARRTARVLRAERAEIAGAPEDTPEPDPREPSASSLPALREAYRAASQVYEQVGVGADLRAEQARAESTENAALAELERLSNKVRARAAQLLEGPDGSDGPSRQAAAGRAEQLVQTLESRQSAASEQLGRLRAEAERLAPDDGDAHAALTDALTPRDADHAQQLLRAANAELATHQEELEQARTAHADIVRSHRAAEDAGSGFDETAALLRDLLRDGPQTAAEDDEPEPYPGDLAEARQAAAEARRGLRGCAADLSTADAHLRDASDVLIRHANAVRYEQVRTPARQQIRELPASSLPEHAAAWAAAFAPRLRVLTDELDQLERNRDSIVDRLRGLVESSLATLRSAQRLSRLPEGLGEWSGQEFLRIRFDDPDHALLTDRLGEVIDEATRAAVRKNSDLRRDGMTLLLRGVGAALEPRGVAVEILKPDAVLRAERVPVGQMGDVFSGGQLLTAAIALYCTMAALRSNDRGRDRQRHAGTLFLDNPIGRANATYLLELQRAVADALGVQLLYTTGLFDTTALAEFPLVVRLRNDADLRAGLKYISVEEHLRPGLPVPDPRGEQVHGEITATRMFRRPAEI
ncbi:hypothetical protein RVR_9336 [Actinacidiphila reveromycinica]|uniref:Chromosome segregation ATPase n=1 Tax=Actinacidiphila reveromycinica TaxID=659352 RepID=A0A7U3VSC1_9ACTN|nr:hypothetical protein [Streptomyces sp. SN-593]BBB01773.1 hypothetical protein RVR_9336 [Streptomyces sp. SN-593]